MATSAYSTESSLLSLLQQKESEQGGYALVRSPQQQEVTLYSSSLQEIVALQEIEDLSGRKGYLLAPFNVTAESPIYLLANPEINTVSVADSHELLPECSLINEGREPYRRCFPRFLQAVQGNSLGKLVLSRTESMQISRDTHPLLYFKKAIQSYPNAYISLVYLPQEGWWLTATPEQLLWLKEGELFTMALAGTRRSEEKEPWSAKNIEEQAVVGRYVMAALGRAGVVPNVSKTYTRQAGNVSHLCTEYRSEISSDFPLLSLLGDLHPTPAVCGYPKEDAFRFILQHEEHSRRYYSGFLGYIDGTNEANLYVTLRCMNLQGGVATLYAGGGIMPNSEMESEWNETEAKLKAMRELLQT